MLIFIILLVVLYIVVVYLRKCKNPVFCNFCNTGDGVALEHVTQDGQRQTLVVHSPNMNINTNKNTIGDIAKTDGKNKKQEEAKKEMKALMPNE